MQLTNTVSALTNRLEAGIHPPAPTLAAASTAMNAGPPRGEPNNGVPVGNTHYHTGNWPWNVNMERAWQNPIERPKFDGKSNPVQFLEQLEKFFGRYQVPGEERLPLAIECLEGEAQMWSEIYREGWTSLDDLKSQILRRYWSDSVQMKIKQEISNGRWDSRKGTMVGHFARFVQQYRQLTIPISEEAFVADMVTHFPLALQSLWMVASTEKTIVALANFLQGQEATTRAFAERRQVASMQRPQRQIATLRSGVTSAQSGEGDWANAAVASNIGGDNGQQCWEVATFQPQRGQALAIEDAPRRAGPPPKPTGSVPRQEFVSARSRKPYERKSQVQQRPWGNGSNRQ